MQAVIRLLKAFGMAQIGIFLDWKKKRPGRAGVVPALLEPQREGDGAQKCPGVVLVQKTLCRRECLELN